MMRNFLVLLLLVCFLTFPNDDSFSPRLTTTPRLRSPTPRLPDGSKPPAPCSTKSRPLPTSVSPKKFSVRPNVWPWFRRCSTAGFVFGGRYGKGVASCRTAKGWSAPAFFTIGGGSFGLQIGGQATDVVMLIMNKGGMNNLLSSQFKLGADASAAAGPVGRHAAADTDWKMRAEVLTYSRSRGLFAGLELYGAVIKQDKDSTREFYGRMVPFKTSLKGDIEAPKAAYPFLSTLAKWAQQAAK